MKKFLVFILLVASCFAYGQEANPYKFTSVIDNYSFGEATANGSIDISIPLYTIKSRELTIPLSLDYTMNGNVNHYFQGSQFGDAWNLNVVGSISRNVQDIRGGYNPSVGMRLYCGGDDWGPVSTTSTTTGPYVNDEAFYQVNPNGIALSQPLNRFMPDVYTFSVFGLSGKFSIYSKGNSYGAELIESTDFARIEITTPPLGENISSIIIYDKKGFKYEFNIQSNIKQNDFVTIYRLAQNVQLYQGCEIKNIVASGVSYLIQNTSSNPRICQEGTVVAGEIHNDSSKFWENLELSKVYDKDNNLLLNYTYESTSYISAGNAISRAINGLGMFQSVEKKYLKEISISGVGKIIFNNIIGSNNGNFVNSYTNSIEFKDLKNTLIKKTEFNYNVVGTTLKRKLLKNEGDANNNLNYYFNKRFLSGVKEHNTSSSSFLNTSIHYQAVKPDSYIHWMGYLVDNGICTFKTSENYKADSFIIQKIKHPTGGSTVYDFESHTFSNHNIFENTTLNYSDENFQNISLTTINNQKYSFTATAGDTIAIKKNLPGGGGWGSSIKLFKDTNLIGEIAMSNTVETCRESYPKFVLPQTGVYTVEVSIDGGYAILAKPNIYHLQLGKANYFYGEGNRIAKVAYFNEDVAPNILKTSSGETAEKLIEYRYTDINDNTKSSGRMQSGAIRQDVENNIFYKNIEIKIRGVGKKVNQYNISETFVKQLYNDIVKSTIYDLNNTVISNEESQFTYFYPSLSSHYPYNEIKPVIQSVNSVSHNYEGSLYQQFSTATNYNVNNRVILSSETTDPLGKTSKSEFDYEVKGNKIVNTQQRNYIDNNLSDQLLHTYGTTGDFIKTQFKTPEMAAYEKVGNENNKHIGGLVRGYIQPDGTPVTLVYGYLDTQIIAKMVNVDANLYYDSPSYQTIRANLDVYSTQWHGSYSEANLKNALNSLRSTFPNALVTTYTYKPMVGVSSVTDENGKTTTYEYDTFNRLATVKDYLGNILKEYQYNFTN